MHKLSSLLVLDGHFLFVKISYLYLTCYNSERCMNTVEQYISKKITLKLFCNAALQRMKVFGNNGWPRRGTLIVWLTMTGSRQSMLWFVWNTLTMKISATFGHGRDWSQELSHQSFHTIEQQKVTDTDEHMNTCFRFFIQNFSVYNSINVTLNNFW